MILYFFKAAGRTFEQGSSKPTRKDLNASILALDAADADEKRVVVEEVVEGVVEPSSERSRPREDNVPGGGGRGGAGRRAG